MRNTLKQALVIRKLLKGVLAINLVIQSFGSFGQTTEPADKTVATLRGLRNLLNSYESIPARDSLLVPVVNLLNTAKSLTDSSKLNRMNQYFTSASANLQAEDPAKRAQIMRWIIKDLELKTALPDSTFHLGLVSTAVFGEPQQVVITVAINDNKQHPMCRLYWDYYRGGLQEAIIRRNRPAGNSNTVTNPFKVDIAMPGYYTFWLIDVQNNQTYKGDLTYQKMIKNDPLTIVFSPL